MQNLIDFAVVSRNKPIKNKDLFAKLLIRNLNNIGSLLRCVLGIAMTDAQVDMKGEVNKMTLDFKSEQK